MFQGDRRRWGVVSRAALGLWLGFVLTAGRTTAAAEEIVAPGATVVQLADGFEFTEGPACDAEGNVLFTDQPNDRIVKWSVDGKLSTFKQPSGRSNGLCVDPAGNLWACADEKNELWSIHADGTVEVVVKDYEGKLLNAPNDLWIRPDRGIYFTDPFYPRDYWKRGASQQSVEGVYYLAPDRKRLTRVVADLQQPNGIIGTPDGKTLYIADIRAGNTYAYDIQADGTLLNKRRFCEMGSDGMTIDNEGNVYLTGKGVSVFNASGEKIKTIPIDAGWTANVCFGGKDRHTLFITAQKQLFALRMRVRGVGSP
ncbi:MAG: SMP-30/gluconolactonase/LRE family protein [Pirellulaceae bacterium]